MAEKEANEIIKQLESLRPIMIERIIDKYEGEYGSIYQYDENKFLVNLAKNYGQFVEAVIYNDDTRMKVKSADIINVVLMILKIKGVNLE